MVLSAAGGQRSFLHQEVKQLVGQRVLGGEAPGTAWKGGEYSEVRAKLHRCGALLCQLLPDDAPWVVPTEAL